MTVASGDGPAFVVHGWPHVRAALLAATESGRSLRLLFPFSFAASLGPAVACQIIARAAAEWPPALFAWAMDCADEPGLALAALREGAPVVEFDPAAPAFAALGAIARRRGAVVVAADPRARSVDLADHRDPLAACRKELADRPGGPK